MAAPTYSKPVHLTILHLNDVYEYDGVDDGRYGGFARLETLRQEALKANPNTIFLFSGDTLSPSVASSFFRGQQMIEMWNALHLDAATLGNHEFDFGPKVLCERIAESQFPWLAANVRQLSGESFAQMPESVVKEVAGVKVGIFGLLAQDTAENSNSGPEVKFQEPVAAARTIVSRLRNSGAQVVVALTHLNLSDDKKIAREVPVDIILGGHEHVRSESLVAGIPILKWGSDARVLGKIDLIIDNGRISEMDWQGIPVNRFVAKDPAIMALTTKFSSKLTYQLDEPLVQLDVALEGRSKLCRQQETNLGNLVADAIREQAGADCGLIAGSSLRVDAVIPAGFLTKRKVMMILPYENGVVKVRLQGKHLWEVMEHAFSEPGPDSSSFPQVSQIQVQYNPQRPIGQRVVQLKVAGQPVQSAKFYTLACSEFLRKGGCGYKMLSQAQLLIEPQDAPAEGVALIEYLNRHEIIAPQLEGRIQVVINP